MVKAGLDSIFNSPAVFTLLVPNDLACTQSGYPQTVIDTFSADQAKAWVLYQTYAGGVLNFESFIGKTEVKLIMANGDSVFISGDSNRTFVNGYQFLNSELTASNGIMLALQNVLIPPSKNLSQLISNDTSLSFLYEAIQLSTPIPDTLINTLSSGGPFTFLAPVNDAFRNQGYNQPSDLSALGPDSLRSMILMNMIPQRLFSNDIADSSLYTTASDSTLLFYIPGLQPAVQIPGSIHSSNLITLNTMATNGVLFKMDSLLLR